ncbi:type IV secretory system conjugative DNA transfer family protein [Nocardia otitidiscaviarum]|uniref:type IV secretory system conjugative DNA transfer family protein n=1 Tax=Nocardia otitidiscaviarum TaxID=1823 RepID=UPI00030D914A|nr:TraM recognition domain-containing protein [Nocardia otitidiscaviarum]
MLSGAALSGLLSGHGFATPGSMRATLSGWISNPADPAAAWASDPRPGTGWLVYTLAALVAALLFTAFWFGYVWWHSRRRAAATPGLSTTRDVAGILDEDGAKAKALTLRPSLHGRSASEFTANELVTRLGINTADGQPIALHPTDSLLVFGPSGSGKTWRTAVAPVLFARGFVAVTSTKHDVLRATCWARAGRGDIKVFDPEDISEWPNKARWSLIAGCEDPDTAIRRAEGMVAARPMGQGSDASAFYVGRATTVIQCYLHAAATAGKRMTDVRRWAAHGANEEVAEILDQHQPEWAIDFRKATDSGDHRTDGNTMSTVANLLKPLASPALMAAIDVSAEESLNLDTLISGSNTLYLLSEGSGRSMAPFVSALLNELHYAAKRRASRMPEGRLDPPMELVLDEVANVAPIPELEAKVTDSGGRGIQIRMFAHGSDQLRVRWGATQAEQLLGSVSAQLILPGLHDNDLLERASKLLGKVDTWRAVPGANGEWRDQPHERLVMSPNEIRTMDAGEALLIYRNLPGIKLRVRAWWEGDEEQAALVKPSLAYYDKVVATGRYLPVGAPARAQVDPTDGIEITTLAVSDFTKGWRR